MSRDLYPQCTIFVLDKNSHIVYGQNLDWKNPLSGYVIVNKRGIHKCILHWKGNWPAAKNDKRTPSTWISKYGSVTFTYLGRDFIEGGMNEVGLMVDEASFMAKYPKDDERPGISCGQWMQYQLDNYETVQQVIEHINDLRPDGEEWHYLIADRYGDICAIEYLDGEPTIYQGESLKYPILTNTSYKQAMSHIPMDKAFGGKIDIASGTDSYGRFIKAAKLMDKFANVNADIVDYAFHILSEVGNETTRRSVVYDSYNKLVLWTSEKFHKRKWIDLNKLDFSSKSKTLIINADLQYEGNMNSYLQEYNEEILQEHLFQKFTYPSHSTIDLLKKRGYTLNEVLEWINNHPLKYNSK
jgi:penicillin V acylase-like amidase (Ntn superfamily)